MNNPFPNGKQPAPLKITNVIPCGRCGAFRRIPVRFVECLKTNIVGQIGRAEKEVHYCVKCTAQIRFTGEVVHPEDEDFLPDVDLQNILPASIDWINHAE